MTQRHLAGARILAQGLVAGHGRAHLAGAVATGAAAEDLTAAVPTPTQVAHAFAATQGQDLPGGIASLALRSGGDIAPVLAAIDRGEIVRGYPMRGTVFLVAADTLAWLTELCAAGPLRQAIARRGRLELTAAHVDRAREVLLAVTADRSAPGTGRGVLRAELLEAWESAGVPTDRSRGYHLLAELISGGDAAYGPWRDGEMAVVDARTWLPEGSDLEHRFGGDRTAATAELALRYLTSRGPAGERDLAWWSKLPLSLIRAAIPLVQDRLESGFADRTGRLHTTAEAARGGDGERLWFRPGLVEAYAAAERATMQELLLPGFDELVLGYPDRLHLMDEDSHRALVPGNNGVFKRAVVRRGQVVATWTRTGSAGSRRLDLTVLGTLGDAPRRRVERLFTAFPYVTP